MNIVSIKNLYFRYSEEDKPIFEDFSLEIEEGSFVAIVGHNGSGKSTLAQMLAGILTPEKGDICVKGYSLTDEKQLEEARPHIGICLLYTSSERRKSRKTLSIRRSSPL